MSKQLLKGKALERYIRDVADQMGLKDWRIDLAPTSPDDDSQGSCETAYGQKVATIRLADHKGDAEDFRNTIVHELLHIHVAPLRYPLQNLREIIGSNLFDTTHETYKDHMEFAVDAIATVWATTFPLPVKAKSKKKRKDKAA